MTAGITGVFWLPRQAEGNSIALNAGAHAVPISAAATAWGGLTAAWVDATATVARVMAELGVGMQGINGISALSKLTGFIGWAEQQGVMAATLGSKAAGNAIAYTVASLAMPSLPEIAAVDAARVAAHSTGGVLNGTSEAAEAAKAALDLRAALTMETYEAATTAMVVTPGEFVNPPAIAHGAGTADAGQADQAFQATEADPVQTAIATAGAFVNNPAVIGAATQAANVAGSVATTGVSTAGTIGSHAIAAVTSAAAPSMTSAAPAATMVGGAGLASAAVSAGTRSASFGSGAAVSVGNGSLKLPEGWGTGAPGGAPTAAPVAENVSVSQPTATPVQRNNTPGSPLLGNQVRDEDDETEHKSLDYLRSIEHFNDGRYAADGVIGAEPAAK
ncbi:PPE family protein [Nocardia tenerifensis]|uniref:PPE family protein n=1 Tax=Nocardia tenerifensis TaxID=228006 RepID=A0A318K4A4_9NOCA|nr:PPE domain-containing protein [Nocardia tenerifensis]PXX63033.1 PPE family protein [Nocardia tenerifensis]